MDQNIGKIAERHGVPEERYETFVNLANDYGWRTPVEGSGENSHEPIETGHLVDFSISEFVYSRDLAASLQVTVDGDPPHGIQVPEDEDVFIALEVEVWPSVIQADRAANAFREIMEQHEEDYVRIAPKPGYGNRVRIGDAAATSQASEEMDEVLDHFFEQVEKAARYDRETAEAEEELRDTLL